MKEKTVDILIKKYGVIACMKCKTSNGKYATRIVFDKVLSLENVDYIKGLARVLFIGTCAHRYAPEIKKTYCIVAE